MAAAVDVGLPKAEPTGLGGEASDVPLNPPTKHSLAERKQWKGRDGRVRGRSPCWQIAPSLLEDATIADLMRASQAGRSLLPRSLSGRIGDHSARAFFEAKEPFSLECALVLAVVHGGSAWHRSFWLNQRANERALADLFGLMDGITSEDGHVSQEEFHAFCTSHGDLIREMPEHFHGLLYEDVRRKAFRLFDTDNSGGFSKEEFDTFFYCVEREYFKYLTRAAHLSFCSFWGRGLLTPAVQGGQTEDDGGVELSMLKAMVRSFSGETVDASASSPYAELSQPEFANPDLTTRPATPLRKYFYICRRAEDMFPRGYWKDFYYYSSNNHPLQGIFVCDRFHPFDWKERTMLELSTWCSSYVVLYLIATPKIYHIVVGAHGARFVNRHLFNLMFATVPGMAWYFLLYFLYTVPCGQIDESKTSVAEANRKAKVRLMCEFAAHALVIMSFILPFACGLLDDDTRQRAQTHDSYSELLVAVMSGRLKAYIIAWLVMFFVYFNPLVAVGDPNPLGEKTLMSKLVDGLALGQWRMEQMRFKALCVHGLWQLERQLDKTDIEPA
mmetsp:Transcript_54365/g.151733  ORF Transcript_54365/g.151733 Transcript_54365/m.151733 type:complete len:557 (-) Transcript_54365:380-2050(-)